MGEYIQPFDFRKIFVELFLGSTELFTFAFIIIFSFVCAKFKMSNTIFMILLGISSLIFAFILGQAIYILIILIIGLISFKSIARLLTQ